MNTDSVVFWMIGLCLVIICLFVLSKPLKALLRIARNALIGAFAFVGMNFLLSPLSISVGVNALTVLIVGILGVPGFLSLYLSRMILGG